MSDPATEPGVPVNAVEVPQPAEKSVAAEVKKRAPTFAHYAATPDRILLRLNKLLASPGGFNAFLSTFNYTLYLLAYLESKSTPLRIKLYQLLNRTSAVPALSINAQPSSIAALGTLLSSTRTTLRLFGLFPMYAYLRQLSAGPKPGEDQVLYATSVTQCLLYMTFQFLENVALLTDNKIVPSSYTTRYTTTPTPGGRTGTAKIYLYAYRAWMGGILCDVVKLFREAQLEREKRAKRSGGDEVSVKADEEVDRKWWAQAVVPFSWLPMAAQFSRESGLPGWNLGLMGVCGGVAGYAKLVDLWAATAE